MAADAIVVAVDVGECFAASLIDALEEAIFDEFGFEPCPEALGLGVVVAVAATAH